MVAHWSWVRAGAVALGICALAGSIVALFATKNVLRAPDIAQKFM